jgi:hypothetical protein
MQDDLTVDELPVSLQGFRRQIVVAIQPRYKVCGDRHPVGRHMRPIVCALEYLAQLEPGLGDRSFKRLGVPLTIDTPA